MSAPRVSALPPWDFMLIKGLQGMEAWTRQAPPGAARLPGPTEPGLVTAKARASSLQGPVPSAHPHTHWRLEKRVKCFRF